MNLYIVRHGESFANAGGEVIYDNPDIPLTEKGHQQALDLVKQLPTPSRIYASAFLRAQNTARPFAEHWHMPIETLPLLNEFSNLPFAHIRGQSREYVNHINEQYWARANPNERFGSDSFADLFERVKRFVDLAMDFPENTVYFGHGLWLQALYWYLEGQNLDDMRTFWHWRKEHVIANASIHHFKALWLHDGAIEKLSAPISAFRCGK